jgi:seryl-tRNA synthetase
MFDLKLIRETPDFFDSGWKRRGLPPQTPTILSMDEKHRAELTGIEGFKAKLNDISKQIGQCKAKKENADDLMSKAAEYKDAIASLEGKAKEAGEQVRDFLSRLPNIPDASVPDGADEKGNVEVRKIGEPKRLNNAKDHVAIGEALGGMDFEAAAKMSGARFVVLRSGVAQLERALGQFMLDTHTREHGYTEVSAPLLVRPEALYGTGQLPKFEEDMFKTTSGHYLVSTSEISLTNSVYDSIVDIADLPLRLTSLSPCFRSEAGAAGRDTKGIIRQHQFYKVEMVSITTAEESDEEHKRMTKCAENILEKLKLPFRTVTLCTGDMGFSARKTYDIEVWLPGQGAYREISSCSNCGDFQARRMKSRYKVAGDKNTTYVHTLNGSGLAVGRTLVAVLENYQQMDGSVLIPDVLKPYMGGITKLEPVAKKGKTN